MKKSYLFCMLFMLLYFNNYGQSWYSVNSNIKYPSILKKIGDSLITCGFDTINQSLINNKISFFDGNNWDTTGATIFGGLPAVRDLGPVYGTVILRNQMCGSQIHVDLSFCGSEIHIFNGVGLQPDCVVLRSYTAGTAGILFNRNFLKSTYFIYS